MPLLSRSLRSLPLLALRSSPSCPPSRRTDGLSLSHSLARFAVPPPCRTVSLPGFSPSPPLSNVLRWARPRSYANVLLRRRPSFAAVLGPPSPPPPLSRPRPPPHLIHIHAVVIVCRLPAGGHYTSCARSRHREATTPATLLLSSLPSPLVPLLCPPPPSFLPLLRRGEEPRVSVNANPRFTTVSSNNLQTYHAVLAGGGSLSAGCLPLAGVCK